MVCSACTAVVVVVDAAGGATVLPPPSGFAALEEHAASVPHASTSRSTDRRIFDSPQPRACLPPDAPSLGGDASTAKGAGAPESVVPARRLARDRGAVGVSFSRSRTM